MKHTLAGIHLAASVIEGLIRRPYALKHRAATMAERRISPADVVAVSSLSLGWAVLPLIHTFTPWLDRFDYRLSRRAEATLGVAGTVVTAAGLYLFWRAHHDLDANWSPMLEISTEHELVTTGAYARVRHPMYSAALVLTVGQALLVHNKVAGPAGLLGLAPMLWLRIGPEERLMRDAFGQAYADYCAQTPRLIPHRRPRPRD